MDAVENAGGVGVTEIVGVEVLDGEEGSPWWRWRAGRKTEPEPASNPLSNPQPNDPPNRTIKPHMQLASGTHIPDGLLAANALLSEKPRHGVPSWKTASHPGIDEANCTAAIGLRASQHLNRARSRYTGKERDTESGLDYFGARYYASSMGRFTSPDPLLNSGRPDDPKSWNRYSYARNNPLTITDPTGLYNLINNCAGDDSKCNKQFNQEAKQLKDGLAALTKAVLGLKDGDQKTALQGALNAIGTENDGNNVGVNFGALGGNAAGQTDINVSAAGSVTGYTVTFDPGKTHGMFDQAINAAHEGQHVEDLSDPRYANNATTLIPFSTEYRGYRTSAYAASALGQNLSYGKNSQYPIWNGSWGAVDRNLTNYITSFRDRAGQQDHPETTPHDPWQK